MKNFTSLGNLAFRDGTRSTDYNLVRVPGDYGYYLPYDMPEINDVLYPGDLVKFVCEHTIEEQENDQYTAQEIDNLIQDLKIDVQKHADDNVYSSKTNMVDTTKPDNDERLVFNFVKTETRENKTNKESDN